MLACKHEELQLNRLRAASNPNPLDLIERHLVAAPVIEAGGAGRSRCLDAG